MNDILQNYFCHNVALDAQLMIFFYLKKKCFFSRYLDFSEIHIFRNMCRLENLGDDQNLDVHSLFQGGELLRIRRLWTEGVGGSKNLLFFVDVING